MEFAPIPGTRGAISESPVWDAARNALLWCDIPAGIIHERVMSTGAHRTWQLPGPVGSFGLSLKSRLVVACYHDILLLDRDTGATQQLASIEFETDRTRLNDGKIGPDGAFWVGTMDNTPAKEPVGALYRVLPTGVVEQKLTGIITSNGLAWNAAGTRLYHSDSRARHLDCYDFDAATGAISNPVQIAELNDAQGRPDGGAVDQDGVYWSAGVTAGLLNRFDAEGRMLEPIPFPVPAPTMPCFGGEDLQTLFVTSISGSIFQTRVTTPGVKIQRFHA